MLISICGVIIDAPWTWKNGGLWWTDDEIVGEGFKLVLFLNMFCLAEIGDKCDFLLGVHCLILFAY